MIRKCLESMSIYNTGKTIAELQLIHGFNRVYKLNSNENPLGPSKEAIKSVENMLQSMNEYPDSNSDLLRSTLGQLLGVSDRQVLIGSGGDEILRLVTEAFIEPDDEAIVTVPYFSLYKNNIQLLNGVLVEVCPDTFEFSPERVLSAITNRTKLIFLTSPNNPTGTIITRQALSDFLSKVPSEIIVLLDEAYCEYAVHCLEYPDGVAYIKDYNNLLIIRTFSKAAGLAGVRVGYAIASENLIQALNKVRLVFNVNRLAQAAALGALQDPMHIQKTIKQNQRALSMLYDYFDRRNFEYVESYGNFIFVNFGVPVQQVINHLIKDGIIITPGWIWGYDTWARISTGTDEAMRALTESLDRMDIGPPLSAMSNG